jgi:uncharacterized membrane protein
MKLRWWRHVPAPVVAEASHASEHLRLLERGVWHDFIEGGVFLTNLTGAILLVFAVVVAVLNLLRLGFSTVTGYAFGLIAPFDPTMHGGPLTLNIIRTRLGVVVCCALQLLVVADVLDTMGKPLEDVQFYTLGKLLLVVVMREGLAFVMAAEVGHLRHENGHCVHGPSVDADKGAAAAHQ